MKLKFTFLMAIAFTLSMFVQNKVSATHLAGADMTYVHLGGNMYELTVTLYRDCDGVDAPSSQPVTFESQSCGFSDEIDLFPIPGTGQEVTFPCVGAATTCNGGSVPGLQKWVYRDTVTLPQSCDDWVFHFDRCCRNCAITTIDVTGCTATAPDMYIETNLDNQNYPNNTSPQFTNTPILYVCLNQPFTYNHGVIDPDGDSLAYSLIAPLQSATTTVDYLPGYSATNPISSSPPVAVDAITGDISLTPTALEVGVIAVLVEEYRNGVLIGSVIRDMQIWVQNCNNDLPTATGIDSTGDYSIVVCPNQQLCFDIFTDDINAGQNITMSWNAGIPDGTFVINNNGTPNPSATFCWTPNNSDINLLTHTFTVTVQDDNCPTNGVQVYSYNIFVPSPYFTLSTTDVSCHGGSDGSAIATPVVTNSPYTYTWSDGQTGQVATGLSAGTYTITVNDTAGCTVVETVVIGEPAPISVTSSVTDASCSGSCDGMVDITVSGDHPPFTYQWSDGSTSEDLNNACPGTYTVIVTDANGCSEDLSVTVGTAGGVLNVNVFTEDESCDGACDGIIELTPTGTGPFTYQWSTGGTSHLETGLCPGTYWFTVTEAGGCSFSDTVVIESGAPFSVTHNVTDITCGGACDGAIEIVSTGSGSFTYQWSTGGSGNIEDGLCPGVYWYTVTNADGCTYTDTVEIEEGDPFTVNTNVTQISCYGECDGAIQLQPQGGNGPFTVTWNGNPGGATAHSLCEGTYTYSVTDANGCSTSGSIDIVEPAPLFVYETHYDESCPGACDGSVDITVLGGTPPFTYNWSNGETTEDVDNLCPGEYHVTVTDAHGCESLEFCMTIEGAEFEISLNAADSSCGITNSCEGEIDLTVEGGNSPFTYYWSNGATTEDIDGLCPGTYAVSVTDAGGCTLVDTTTLVAPSPIIIGIADIGDESCGGACDGYIDIDVFGGVAPYTYEWSNGATTEDVDNLCPGTYHVTVSDALGCVATQICFVLESGAGDALTVTGTGIDTDPEASTGSVDITVTGGTGPYTYQWNNGASTEDILGLPAGNYCVVVTDANGCTGDVCVTVGVNATLTCQQPAGVIFTNVQTTEVTINWNPVNALSTQIQYRQQGVPGVNNSIAGAGISSKILTGLITGATYQCRLRHNCPDTGLTPWKYKPFMTSVLRSFDAAVSLEAYPNPTEGTLNVAITTAKDEALTLTVMSLLGEQLVSKSINLQEGVNLTKVDLSNYNSGIYLIQLEGENVKLYEKVMKVN